MKLDSVRGRVSNAHVRGLTFLELIIAIAIVAILVSVAMPAYREQMRRSSRTAAQSQLLEMAATQEKIFLNSNAYTNKIVAPYDGTASGGLGVSTGKTADGRYALAVSISGGTFTLRATPVAGSSQAGDGVLTIDSSGDKTWGTKTW
jgi:type IV pilus assembly protein PilE